MIRKVFTAILMAAALLLPACSAGLPRANPIPNTGGGQPALAATLPPAPALLPSATPAPATPTPAPKPTRTYPPMKTPAPPRGNSAFTVAQVDILASLGAVNYSGSCEATYTFVASIITSGPGKVTYHWVRSDGTTTPKASLTYAYPGIQRVADTWTLKSAEPVLTGWTQIYIDEPNDVAFTAFAVHLDCTVPIPPTPTMVVDRKIALAAP